MNYHINLSADRALHLNPLKVQTLGAETTLGATPTDSITTLINYYHYDTPR